MKSVSIMTAAKGTIAAHFSEVGCTPAGTWGLAAGEGGAETVIASSLEATEMPGDSALFEAEVVNGSVAIA